MSYDDPETLLIKRAFANNRCLGGFMIWALDQDDRSGTLLQAVAGTSQQPNGRIFGPALLALDSSTSGQNSLVSGPPQGELNGGMGGQLKLTTSCAVDHIPHRLRPEHSTSNLHAGIQAARESPDRIGRYS